MRNMSVCFLAGLGRGKLKLWFLLVFALIEGLYGSPFTELFGLAEVSQWNFESWNEPQNKKHFDGLHVTTKGYLMYYDACSEGLKMAHPSLRLGGPATGYPDKHPIFWVQS